MFENVISVCYHGGCCGHAIAAVIQFSPEIYKRGPDVYQDVLPTGELYDYGMRCGRADDQSTDFDIVRCYEQLNRYYSPMKSLDRDAIDLYHQTLPQLWLRPHRVRFLDAIAQSRFLIADHSYSSHQRQLLPGCRTIAVYGDIYQALRYFADKKYIPIDVDDPEQKRIGIDTFTGFYGTTVPRIVRYKESMRSFVDSCSFIDAAHRQDCDSFNLDYIQLLFSDHSEQVYLNLIKWLDLTPNWSAVRDFMHTYADAQLTRLTRKMKLL